MNRVEFNKALQRPTVRAFLRVIRAGESSQEDKAYTTLFGGGQFESFADHPRIRFYEKFDGQFIKNGKIDYTTAAGAYQITETTWNGLCRRYGFTTFTPQDQDEAAVALIYGRKALDHVLNGNIRQAMYLCRMEWASLPDSPLEEQPSMPLDKALKVYDQYFNQYNTVTKSVEEPINISSPVKETTMPFPLALLPAIISAFGPAIQQLIPQVSKLFDQSDVAKRNTELASTVLNTIVETAGKPDVQEAIVAMQNDPIVAANVRQAVITHPEVMGILEVTGGIAKAREYGLAVQQSDKPFWYNPVIWVSLMLMIMPFMLLIDVFYIHPDSYDGNLRVQIVTAVLGVILVVGGFWLGSSSGSMKKDDVNAAKQAALNVKE